MLPRRRHYHLGLKCTERTELMSDTLPDKAESKDLATTTDDGAPEGLEDMDQSDLVMPRLKIDHDSGKFVDNLSGAEYDKMEVILLGLIKQRILWSPEPSGDNDKPLCKSFDFQRGVPGDGFPVKASGFDPALVDAGELPCVDCKLKEWGSHPNRDTPWCSEQHTFALLLPMSEDDPTGAPALLSVQRSAIKPSKQYLTAFARSRQPLYTVQTELSLDQRRRGSVDYAVPKFIRRAATDESLWPEFAQQYRMIRDFVQTPSVFGDTDAEEDAATGATPSKSDEATAPAAADTAPVDDDDDLPF